MKWKKSISLIDMSDMKAGKEHAGFITGTDLRIDGGVIAAIGTGTYSRRGGDISKTGIWR